MSQMTREMILKQRNTQSTPYPARPPYASSASSARSSSPQPSLSSTCSSPASSSRSSAPSGRLSTPSAHPSQSTHRPKETAKECWIPTLDEVSRAEPAERKRIFERLAREAEMDARGWRLKAGGVPRKSLLPSNASPVTKPYGTSVEIGAMALQLVRPHGSRPIEHPTLGGPTPTWSGIHDSNNSKLAQEERMLFSEWLVDMPDSPVSSSWGMNCQGPSEDMIARWTQEDAETERRTQEERAWKLAFAS